MVQLRAEAGLRRGVRNEAQWPRLRAPGSRHGLLQAAAEVERDWLAFLTDAQRHDAAEEWAALQKIDTAPNELGRWATQWVEAHPTDPRAPKILYQVVRATRYGCTDAQTGAVSHRAFTLLHRRYPNSEWATKTPDLVQ